MLSKDVFIDSENYSKFKQFKKSKNKITSFLLFGKELELTDNQIEKFINTNKESYITYEVLGKYYFKKGQKNLAKRQFKIALTKKVASLAVEKELYQLIKECEK